MVSQMAAQSGATQKSGGASGFINKFLSQSLFDASPVRARLQSKGYSLDPNTGILVRPNSMANKARGTGSSAIYNPATGKI